MTVFAVDREVVRLSGMSQPPAQRKAPRFHRADPADSGQATQYAAPGQRRRTGRRLDVTGVEEADAERPFVEYPAT
jgi:hypothetical protein